MRLHPCRDGGDRGVLLGFKWSSQHLCAPISAAPGDHCNTARNARSEHRLLPVIATPSTKVLRRPLETALAAPVAMMDEAALCGTAVVQRLLQGIEDEVRMRRPRHPPADDPAGEDVDDEGHVDEALPGRHVGVSRPEELHLRPLSEPDVNLSAHPAPIIQSTTDTPATNERTHPAAFAPSA